MDLFLIKMFWQFHLAASDSGLCWLTGMLQKNWVITVATLVFSLLQQAVKQALVVYSLRHHALNSKNHFLPLILAFGL